MPVRRRRRQRLERKYLLRRMIVLLLPVVLIVSAVLILTRLPAAEKAAAGSASQATSGDEDGTEETGETKAAEPETEPETEPKPVPVPWNLLLVNSTAEIPEDYEDGIELEFITGNFEVDSRIIEFYTEMSNQAKEDGVELMICSAYRSVEKQEELFNGYKEDFIAEGMSDQEAEGATLAYTARPGTSEHHTGLALDIVTPEYQNLDEGYAETASAKWLLENAATYGFILRYPQGKESLTNVSFEPWHYRYVGVEAAEAIMEGGYCLEEYLRLGASAGETEDAPEDAGSADESSENETSQDEPDDETGE